MDSAAAPTAGLHFTEELIEQIKDMGVNTAYLTLHVGLGTFRPVSVENVEEHVMHSERYEINEETADLINRTRENGGRINRCRNNVGENLRDRPRTTTDGLRPRAGTRIYLYIRDINSKRWTRL